MSRNFVGIVPVSTRAIDTLGDGSPGAVERGAARPVEWLAGPGRTP